MLICVHIVATVVVLDELFGLKLSRISFSAYLLKIVTKKPGLWMRYRYSKQFSTYSLRKLPG